jgi:hypothetical protein
LGAGGSAVLVAGLATWAVIGAAPGKVGGAELVTSTITLAEPGQTFAPPPPGVSPALTAQQAIDAFEHKHVKIPSMVRVQLGLYTRWVGPNCGYECEHGNIVSHGKVYAYLNRLVYGFSRYECPPGSHRPVSRCTQWDFIDANTGKYIEGIGVR